MKLKQKTHRNILNNKFKSMRKLMITIRLLGIMFYSWLYFKLQFDIVSCVLGVVLLLVITSPQSKKSEADTSDS